MNQLGKRTEFVEKLQHALDAPIQALGNLRAEFLSLKIEINNGHKSVDLELRINELISQAHEKAPHISEKFIKGLLFS